MANTEYQPVAMGMPKLPVAGFWVRFFAIALDMIIIMSTVHFLTRASFLEPLFWFLGESSRYVTMSVIFFYFFLCHGPLGKGKTIGKALLRVHVRDFDGGILTHRQAFFRTLLLFPFFLTWPLFNVLGTISPGLFIEWLSQMAIFFLTLAVLTATVVTVAFNPFKQGLHDYFAESLVFPNLGSEVPEEKTFQYLTEEFGPGWQKFHKHPQVSGGITIALLFVALGVMTYPSQMPDSTYAIRQESINLSLMPGFWKASFSQPIESVLRDDTITSDWDLEDDPDPSDYVPIPSWLRANATSSDEFFTLYEEYLLTTGTLRLQVYVRFPGSPPQDVTTDEFKANAEVVATQYYEKVLPHWIEQFAERAEDSAYLGAKVLAWRERPITLEMIFVSQIHLPPSVRVLQKPLGRFEKSFPSVGERISDN